MKRLQASATGAVQAYIWCIMINDCLQERRWRALGAHIQKLGGVLSAEEMAPFLNPPPLGRRVRRCALSRSIDHLQHTALNQSIDMTCKSPS